MENDRQVRPKQNVRASPLVEPAQLDTHQGTVGSIASSHWQLSLGQHWRGKVATSGLRGDRRWEGPHPPYGGSAVGRPSCRQTQNGDSQSHHESHDGCFRLRYSRGKAVSGTSGHFAPKEGVQLLKLRREAVHVRRRHNHLGLDLEPVVQAHQERRCGAATPPHADGGPPILKTVRYTLGPHDRTRVDKEG